MAKVQEGPPRGIKDGEAQAMIFASFVRTDRLKVATPIPELAVVWNWVAEMPARDCRKDRNTLATGSPPFNDVPH